MVRIPQALRPILVSLPPFPMRYIDGFVLVIPRDKLAAYKKMAADGGKIWKKHGALEYVEAVGDDMEPDMGGMKALTFPKLTKVKDDEVPIFSFIIYESKAHRDRVNAKVMKEMHAQMENKEPPEMPFDLKRMAYGGFKAIVDIVQE
jgi:uncharacterized protein YbaA (DUF1428 family)